MKPNPAHLAPNPTESPLRVSLLRVCALAMLLACSFSAHAQEVTPTKEGLNSAKPGNDDPAAELASFAVAEGFEVELWASEKEGVVKPINCRFDRLGRLWVIGSGTYPQVKPGEVPNDYVKVLEDTDGDGKADKVTTFAEGLYVPTGIEVDADGRGAWIGEGTKLWHMRDEDGDGKADRKEVVLRGFGTGDNHQNINSFRFSPGGELLMSQGLHAFSRVETPHGVVALSEAGYFKFRPRRQELVAFWGGHGDPQNPWGFVWDDWGNLFVQAGNNGSVQDALVSAFEGGCGPRPGQIWKDARGRKGSNPALVGTSHFPPEWQGRLIVPGYINNAVWALDLKAEGSTFVATDVPPLIKSTHGSFRPMDAEFGPDGSLFIADWYNPIIGHYQASFRHPDRDKAHGRIWRVKAKGRALVKPAGFLAKGDKAPLAEIIKGLESGERFERDFARRILGSMDAKVVLPAVKAWALGAKGSASGSAGVPPAVPGVPPGTPNVDNAPLANNAARNNDGPRETRAPAGGTPTLPADHAIFEALCVHEWHEVPDEELLDLAFYSDNAILRAHAALFAAKSIRWDAQPSKKVLPDEKEPTTRDTARIIVNNAMHDPVARVRLAGLIGAMNSDPSLALTIIASRRNNPGDPALDFAIKETVIRTKHIWEPMLDDLDDPEKIAFSAADIAFLKDPVGYGASPAPKKDAALAKFVDSALKGAGEAMKATPEFTAALAAEIREKGDTAKGALIFKKAELGCIACHRVGNEGGTMGPDLNNIGSAQPLDFIIGAVIEPNREIKEGFETRLVTTKDGRTFSGFRRASAPDELALWDAATQQDVKLKLADVTDNKPLPSLMPAGLVDKLPREDLRDLLAYLAKLGK